MTILVFDERQPERDLIASALQRCGLVVKVAPDAKALTTMLGDPHEVIVLGWRSHVRVEDVRAARHACPSGYMIVVVDTGADITALLSAGAQDFIRRPLLAEEIAARVVTPGRVRTWERAIPTPGIASLPEWNNVGGVVAEALSQVVGSTIVALDHAELDWSACLHSATIPLSLANERVEVRVSILADRRALDWLGHVILGEPAADDVALADVLRELSNIAGGAVKRTLSDHGTFTMGLPKNGPLPNGDDKCTVWRLRVDAELFLVVEQRKRENLRISATQLAEGMVLVSDLRNDAGALLVAAGTRLTLTSAERVARILGSGFVVEVADAAA